MTAAEIIALLRPTTPDLSPRLRAIEKVWEVGPLRVKGHFHYLALRDSKPTVNELLDVAHKRIVNFALPRSRIRHAIDEMTANPGSADAWVALSAEARDLFIKTRDETKRSGELGEILLFMLAEWVLRAPIVACKMYLKTAHQMPVHGRDGIHLGFDGDQLVVYWGESKLHQEISSALSDIVVSISDYIADAAERANEVRIIRANLDLDQQDPDMIEAIRAYFNPWNENSNLVSDRFVCLAGFDSKIYKAVESLPHAEAELAFIQEYERRIDSAGELLKKYIEEAHLEGLHFNFFLLPFPSIEDARSAFQKLLWGDS